MHEYHKRWSAFVASAIKLDEVLAPISFSVNQIYMVLFPGFPSQPVFSVWRFMTKVWQREVFQPLKAQLGRVALDIVDEYSQASLLWGLEKMAEPERRMRKEEKSSGFFSKISPKTSPMYNSIGGGNKLPSLLQLSQPAIPLVNSGNSSQSTAPSEMVDLGDGQASLIDIDSVYQMGTNSEVPDLKRVEKVCLGHCLNDFLDMSIHEYSVQYVSHTKCGFDGPLPELCVEMQEQFV